MSEPQSPGDESPRSRSTAIASVGFLLLALPFLVLGLYLLDVKSLTELRCEPGGPCTLSRAGWLTREEVGRFTLEEIQGVKVEGTRSARRSREPIFRPELVTARGTFPLFSQWAKDEAEATAAEAQVRRYLSEPRAGGLALVKDDRRSALRVGGSFTGVGAALLAFSGWLALRSRAHRRAERRGMAAAP